MVIYISDIMLSLWRIYSCSSRYGELYKYFSFGYFET